MLIRFDISWEWNIELTIFRSSTSAWKVKSLVLDRLDKVWMKDFMDCFGLQFRDREIDRSFKTEYYTLSLDIV